MSKRPSRMESLVHDIAANVTGTGEHDVYLEERANASGAPGKPQRFWEIACEECQSCR